MWRLLYLLAACGFTSQAIAAAYGVSPPWPNRYVWAIVASIAALTIVGYAVTHDRRWLRLATASILLAAVGRTIGWAASHREWASKLAAAGVWTIVGSLALLVYVKAGRLEQQ